MQPSLMHSDEYMNWSPALQSRLPPSSLSDRSKYAVEAQALAFLRYAMALIVLSVVSEM